VRRQGLSGISVRTVAAATGVATGTLYHYFPDKRTLVMAVVADVWRDVFSQDAAPRGAADFCQYVDALYRAAHERLAAYPGFAQGHGLKLVTMAGRKDEGRARMQSFLDGVGSQLQEALRRDPHVRQGALAGGLTSQGLARFVTQSLLAGLMLGQPTCDDLLAVLRAALY
jgi:AcrR family transcriptional regulator